MDLSFGRASLVGMGILVGLPLPGSQARADDVMAASCSAADVGAAIALAASGDTIRVPAGRCTWSEAVILDASVRDLHLVGAGADATIITTMDAPLAIDGGTGRTWTVSHLGFEGGTGLVTVRVSGTSRSWRIHDLAFHTDTPGATQIFVGGATYGVIDHVEATGAITHFSSINDSNWESWSRGPTEWGTDEAVFIEDCVISCDGCDAGLPSCLDGERGGRAVFRHNRVTNAGVNGHGFDSGAAAGMLSQEIYGNEFTVIDPAAFSGGLIRGGTALMYENHWDIAESVFFSPTMPLAVYRSLPGSGGDAFWGACDGTPRRLCSNIDASWNITGFSPFSCVTDADCVARTTMLPPVVDGITCAWQFCSEDRARLCRADADCPAGQTCTAYLDGGAPDGYPCYQQVGFGGEMRSTPLYEWDNTVTGGTTSAVDADLDYSSNHTQILEGRDFFNDTPLPGYAPYPYPHPLRALDGGEPLGEGGCACRASSPARDVRALGLVLMVGIALGLSRRASPLDP